MGAVRSIFRLVAVFAACSSAAAFSPAFADCQMVKIGSLQLESGRNRPYIGGQINAQAVSVLADTGANQSFIWGGALDGLGLKPTPSYVHVPLLGNSGKPGSRPTMHTRHISLPKYVTLDELKVGDYFYRDKLWRVVGEEDRNDDEFAMVLGADFLLKHDVEFDLAGRQVVLWATRDCEQASLAYWNREFMLAKLEQAVYGRMETEVSINGIKFRGLLATGAQFTALSIGPAFKAGFRRDDPEAKEGPVLHGYENGDDVPSHIVRFDSFQLGDLTVKNAKLVVTDLHHRIREVDNGPQSAVSDDEVPDLILGADFFRANRVLISRSQGYMYFTHNGGTIFDAGDSVKEKEEQQNNGTQ